MITLNTSADLLDFATELAGGRTFMGQTVTLGADIDLNPGWTSGATPPANIWGVTGSGDNFFGTFDGQGHTVSGLYVANTGAATVSMFGRASGNGSQTVTIQNLRLINSYFSNSQLQPTSALIAYANGVTLNIDNVYVDAKVVSSAAGGSSNAKAGGLIGCVDNVATTKITVEKTTVKGYLLSTDGGRPIGGLYGRSGWPDQGV